VHVHIDSCDVNQFCAYYALRLYCVLISLSVIPHMRLNEQMINFSMQYERIQCRKEEEEEKEEIGLVPLPNKIKKIECSRRYMDCISYISYLSFLFCTKFCFCPAFLSAILSPQRESSLASCDAENVT